MKTENYVKRVHFAMDNTPIISINANTAKAFNVAAYYYTKRGFMLSLYNERNNEICVCGKNKDNSVFVTIQFEEV